MKTVLINKLFYLFIYCLLISCKGTSQKKETNKVEIEKNSYSFQEKLSDTLNYIKYQLDIDKDGKMDIIFSSKHLVGDSLFVFKNNENKYELSLKTINFSEDGLFFVKNIEVPYNEKNCIKISTYFNGSGGMLKDIYLSCDDAFGRWKLDKAVYKNSYCDQDDACYEKICNIKEDIILNNNTDWSKYRDINNAQKKECSIKNVN